MKRIPELFLGFFDVCLLSYLAGEVKTIFFP